jgi:hypothetical protein
MTMTAEQLPLFDDPAETARAERQRIVRERLAELELDRMYGASRAGTDLGRAS